MFDSIPGVHGLTFHNGGAPIKGLEFRIIKAEGV